MVIKIKRVPIKQLNKIIMLPIKQLNQIRRVPVKQASLEMEFQMQLEKLCQM